MLVIESDNEPVTYLTIDEVSKYLNVGHFTAYKLAKNPAVHSIKLSNRWLIPQDDLFACLKSTVQV